MTVEVKLWVCTVVDSGGPFHIIRPAPFPMCKLITYFLSFLVSAWTEKQDMEGTKCERGIGIQHRKLSSQLYINSWKKFLWRLLNTSGDYS